MSESSAAPHAVATDALPRFGYCSTLNIAAWTATALT